MIISSEIPGIKALEKARDKSVVNKAAKAKEVTHLCSGGRHQGHWLCICYPPSLIT